MQSKHYIVIPIEGTVIFPHTVTKLAIDAGYGKRIETLMEKGDLEAVAVSKKANQKADEKDQFYSIGVKMELFNIKPSDDGYLVKVIVRDKVVVDSVDMHDGLIEALVSVLYEEDELDEVSHETMLSFLKTQVHEVGEKFPGTEAHLKRLDQMKTVDQLLGEVMPYLNVTMDKKQKLLELNSTKKRGLYAIEILRKQKDAVDLQIEMAQRYSKKNNKNYREQLLREQLKAIQEELGELGDGDDEQDLEQRVLKALLPDPVAKIAKQELKKLARNGQNNSENSIIRSYLELILELPWQASESKPISLDRARKILDQEHYGLESVKQRIIQHLAVMKLKKEKQGSILLLVGPPGTGKTSLGKSIAKALGRPYVRMSLGGVKDEAEIRGHRRTYIGAMPGRVIQGMKEAGHKNPVMVLDEIDKLAASYNGDPASALLEVLDPEQNNSFADHYLNVPYDLSQVFFVATANNINAIPAPLKDRMEIITMSSYTETEKYEIAKRHLLKEVLEAHGLSGKDLTIHKTAMMHIINQYTREAGVRGLKKQLAKITRMATEKVVMETEALPIKITTKNLEAYLGKPAVRHDEAGLKHVPGVVTGLAYTPVGGEILFIEGTFMPGNGKLMLTGQLGDVMKESAQISMSLIRSRLRSQLAGLAFAKHDIHIHVPQGATPKDGPSAGVALFIALTSLVLGRAVDAKLAITGEITLRGLVMPVGGIKEKVLAAHRAGIKTVILPKDNERDVKEIPEEVKNALRFIFVKNIEDVVKYVFDIPLEPALQPVAQIESHDQQGMQV